jgi:hypothetical protein
MDTAVTKSYRDFARELVTTGEIDPLYTMLYRARAEFGDKWVASYCMAMLLTYNAKTACEITDVLNPYDYLWNAYEEFARGKERRYFRGEAGKASLRSIEQLGQLDTAFFSLGGTKTLPELKRRARELGIVGFGDYFLIKWADLLHNVFLEEMYFGDLYRHLPDPPLKCLKTVFPDMYPKAALEEIVSWISDLDDPFSGTRKCSYSEAETIACAIPSYLIRARYQMGDDIAKYREQLKGYPSLARLLP